MYGKFILPLMKGIAVMKYLVLIPDGMADEKLEALGNRTPMEAANKPTMDALAKKAALDVTG